jgi:hypothetical protein
MKEDKLMAHDPMSDADSILTEECGGVHGAGHHYSRRSRSAELPEGAEPRQRAGSGAIKPTHYKVICISMYTRDIEELEAKVAELKRRGYPKASKSQLIRLALSQIDLDKLGMPRE